MATEKVTKKSRVLINTEPEVSYESSSSEEEQEQQKKKKKKVVVAKVTKEKPKKAKKKKEAAVVEEEEEEEEASEEGSKKVRAEKVMGHDEMSKLLVVLSIKYDHKAIESLEKHDKKRYTKLVDLLEPLTIAYNGRTPVGRIFAYDDKTKKFEVLRDSSSILKLDGCEQKDFSARKLFDALDESEQEVVLATLGEETTKPSEAQLLFGLVQTKIIKSAEPEHADPCLKCVIHDESTQQSHWVPSKEVKAKLGGVFVLKLKKKVTKENIGPEIDKLIERRSAIEKLLASESEPKEKKKKDKKPKKDEKSKKEKKIESPKKKKEEEEEAKVKKQKEKIVILPPTETPKKRKKEEETVDEVKEKEAEHSLPIKKKPRLAELSASTTASKKQPEITPSVKNSAITIKKQPELPKVADSALSGLQSAAQIRAKISGPQLRLREMDKELDPVIKWFTEHCS